MSCLVAGTMLVRRCRSPRTQCACLENHRPLPFGSHRKRFRIVGPMDKLLWLLGLGPHSRQYDSADFHHRGLVEMMRGTNPPSRPSPDRNSNSPVRALSQSLARTELSGPQELEAYRMPFVSAFLAHARDNVSFYK